MDLHVVTHGLGHHAFCEEDVTIPGLASRSESSAVPLTSLIDAAITPAKVPRFPLSGLSPGRPCCTLLLPSRRLVVSSMRGDTRASTLLVLWDDPKASG